MCCDRSIDACLPSNESVDRERRHSGSREGGVVAPTDERQGDERGIDERRQSYLSIAGHPIHALSIPVPVGAYVAATLSVGIWALRGRDPFWHRVGIISGASAAVTAMSVAVSGIIDYFTLVRHPRAIRVGAAHMLLNSAAVISQVLALWAGWERRSLGGRRGKLFVGMQAMAFNFASLAAFAGGDLVYRHRIGVFGGGEEGGMRRPRERQ